MIRLPILLFLLFSSLPAGAVLRQSGGDGRWDRIEWQPAGLPQAGDTLRIRHTVEGLGSELYALVLVDSSALLSIQPSTAVQTSRLINEGSIELGIGSVLRVTSHLLNRGVRMGEGVTVLTAPAHSGGGGSIGHLIVDGTPGSALTFDASTQLRTLTIERGTTVEIGAVDLSVDGAYYSYSAWGEHGIHATTGTIRLGGDVRGTARGTVILGNPHTTPGATSSSTVDGVIGDTGRSVTVHGSHDLSFSTFVGDLIVGPHGHLRGTGIGLQGRNIVKGDLLLDGEISATEPDFIWEIHGGVVNRGRINSGTITMVGDSLTLDNGAGVWNPDARLQFRGRSNGRLSIVGDLTLSRLDVGAASDGDTNVVVDAGGFPVHIRHLFRSDIGRACRLRSDTTVGLRAGADGWIDADIRIEGFQGRDIAGRFGGDGREVQITVPRTVTGAATFSGRLVQQQHGALAVTGSMVIEGSGRFNGLLTLDTAAVLRANGRLELPWITRGGGRIILAGGADTLEAAGAIVDSITVEVGTDSSVSSLYSTHAVSLPRLWVHAGSRIDASELEMISTEDWFRYDIVHASGWHRASAATVPSDPRPRHYFGNTTSSIFRFVGNAYQIADSIRPGEGIWMNVPEESVIAHRGEITTRRLMIPVQNEWNLVGPGSFHALTGTITCRGCTIESGFFDTGNNLVTTLEPGRGYWVRVGGNGIMTIGE